MQYFKDAAGCVHVFDDDVTIETAPDGTTTATAPDGSVLNAPTDLTPYTRFELTAADQLAAAQSAKIAEINAACEAAIVSGFESDALGGTYSYRSRRDDQINLLGAAMGGTATKCKCADSNGVWAMRDHTASQIKKVFDDGVTRKLSLIEQSNALTAQVNAITPDDDAPLEAVQTITWSAF